ncbi:hypothetical protein [Terrisporobacter mayombei]|uniref:Uncharacterized protein n=1 Tax=Terrisporobacter mayombei TaxID=1541 RepID=A0ABY9Q639_9FIRM|nr:hypothetical protein [Terrisporobacter mayombei]MCC3869595.1 hypothetical protein [Terrisporobacter mayombei]WMT83467.1 hypothetical protein TEMA_39840 [Terrisporobacter mayombei]
MKKVFTIIISAILICLIGLGIIGYYVEKDKAAEKTNAKTEEKVDQIIEEEKLVVDSDKIDVDKIDGYTAGEDLVSQDNTNNNLEQGNSEAVTVGGINLPYSIPNKNMEIISIGQYSGKFVEDGSDINKDNVLSIIVKNTSKEVIDYGEINMKIIGKTDTMKFKITNLKPGVCALVMESSGKIEFNSEDKYIYMSSKHNMISDLSTMESQVAVTREDKKITVENLSDKNLNTVYVYYKTISPGGCYLGGITYRAKFENVEGGKNISSNTIHFSNKNCEILKVESVKE